MPVESFYLDLDSANTLLVLPDKLANHFKLGWRHYVNLLTITNPDERRFYEKRTGAGAILYFLLENYKLKLAKVFICSAPKFINYFF